MLEIAARSSWLLNSRNPFRPSCHLFILLSMRRSTPFVSFLCSRLFSNSDFSLQVLNPNNGMNIDQHAIRKFSISFICETMAPP
ncbi:hypothetical protein MARPO_0110s0032 [Marchantia polymorpha]|uniref:Uncharacterized protein n=1 Tax=Marchantia polymorpha TaxID=3197 RepID=A0A2R6WA85_MARPO|nr:hypothetical protein MARPO_0120s0032 [Marchantia polymorpha]PTQ31540.1 hypothetical protein MARPO_0110s0032 [Marchantia polymorpha]|eukprot:PTQ30756.1 hypothetical protein MARPO_0120s0032 [Marchantia polymorpha]